MSKPVIMTVDDEPEVLNAVEHSQAQAAMPADARR